MTNEFTAARMAETAIANALKHARNRQIEATLAREILEVLHSWGDKKLNRRLSDQLRDRAADMRIPGVISVTAWYNSVKDKWKSEPEITLYMSASLDEHGVNRKVSANISFPASTTAEDREAKLSYYLRGDIDADAIISRDPEEVKALFLEHVTLSARLRAIKDELDYPYRDGLQ